MTVPELIRQCGNPEYTIRVEDPVGGHTAVSLEIIGSGKDPLGWVMRVIVGQLVRIRNQDGAELDRAGVSAQEIATALGRGAVDKRGILRYPLQNVLDVVGRWG